MIEKSVSIHKPATAARGQRTPGPKFIPPEAPPGLVARHGLEQSIARGLTGRAILLVASAGYGKTSLLAAVASEWGRYSAETRVAHLAWYQMDPSDDDAAVFLEGLVESVRREVPEFGRMTLGALKGTADARGEMQRLVSVFVDELGAVVPGRLFLLLDDFQCITDRAILGAIERPLQDPKSPLRVIISTRTDPAFYLSVLRSRDELLELHESDLRFTIEELDDLVRGRVGHRVSRGAAEEVLRTTGGWPSAANLASLIMGREKGVLPFNRLAPTEHGYRLLVREVLAGLPQPKRDLVLRTSLLGNLDPNSSRDVEGWEGSPEILRLVKEIDLPTIRVGGPGAPLRYEPLFRSALERELSATILTQEHRSLREKLAAYHSAQGDWDEAIRLYSEAGAHEEAAAIVAERAEVELSLGHLDTVLRWIRSLPKPVLGAHPRLMVQQARLLLDRDRQDEARVLLGAALRELEARKDELGMAQRLGAVSALRLTEGRWNEARLSALESLEQLPEKAYLERAEVFWVLARSQELLGDLAGAFASAGRGLLAAERSGWWSLVVRAMLQLGWLAHLRGDLSKSLALSARAVQRSVVLGAEATALSMAGATASSIYLDRAQAIEARQVAARSLETSARLHDLAGQVRSQLALAAAMERLGQPEAGRVMLEEAVSLALQMQGRLERVFGLQAVAASLLRQGKRSQGVEKAADALQAAMGTGHQPLIDQCRLLLASAEMVGVRRPIVLARIRRLVEAFRRGDSRRWLAAGLQLVAHGYLRLGLRGLARAHLAESLALAASEGYMGMPLGLPSKRSHLLGLAARDGVAAEMAGALLDVDQDEARRVLAPLLSSKDDAVRARAQRVAKGIDMGAGKLPGPRVLWPDLPEAVAEAAPKVSLRTLGGLDAFVDGRLVEWPSADARQLAAYLFVSRGRSRARDRVLRDLWAGEEEPLANLRLHVGLYRLREALGSGFPHAELHLEGRGAYRWGGAGVSTDADQFRRLLARARQLLTPEHPPALSAQARGLLEGAAELYRGEFLAGLEFDWCVLQREELRSQLKATARLLIDHFMALRDWRAAIRYGLQSLKSDPLQEDVVRDMMVCYFRIGDRSAVRQQYREVKRLLAKERGLWPSEETRHLRIRLLGK